MALTAATARADTPVTVYTENWPPYSYLKEGQIAGKSTEAVRRILDGAGIDFDIKMVPWSRAYELAKSRPNTLIYSILRTPDREAHFEWLTPLFTLESHLFGATSAPDNVTRQQIRNGNFTAVCVLLNASCELLRNLGFSEDRIYRVPDKNSGAKIRIVIHGRADFYLSEPNANAYIMEQLGLDRELVKSVLVASHDKDLYLASNRGTDPEIIRKIRSHLNGN